MSAGSTFLAAAILFALCHVALIYGAVKDSDASMVLAFTYGAAAFTLVCLGLLVLAT